MSISHEHSSACKRKEAQTISGLSEPTNKQGAPLILLTMFIAQRIWCKGLFTRFCLEFRNEGLGDGAEDLSASASQGFVIVCDAVVCGSLHIWTVAYPTPH